MRFSLRLLLADTIDCTATSDRDRPSRHAGSSPVDSSCRGPQFDENLLGDFFGHRRIAQHPGDCTEHDWRDGVVQLGEGGLVSTLDALDEPKEVGVSGEDRIMMPGMDHRTCNPERVHR